jgi:dihydropyrimidinase
LLSIIYTYGVEKNLISIEKLVELLSTNAAKIFGLYPKKGIIQIESDADLVIYNPYPDYLLRAKDLHMSTDFNPFEGMKLKGKVKMTILRGKVIVEESEFKGASGDGQFIKGKRGICCWNIR